MKSNVPLPLSVDGKVGFALIRAAPSSDTESEPQPYINAEEAS